MTGGPSSGLIPSGISPILPLLEGEEPPRLVVYVPLAEDETEDALIELTAAGVSAEARPTAKVRLRPAYRCLPLLGRG